MEKDTNQKSQSTNPEQTNETPKANDQLIVSQVKLEAYMNKLKLEQNLPMAIIAGLVACLISALIWAAVTVATEYQIGYMAIAVGFIVGFAVKFAGKGIDTIYGIIGAAFALLGCVLGNFFSIIGFVANSEGLGYLETLNMIDYSLLPEIMTEGFSPVDLLFYGFALYGGYKFAFRSITEEEILEHATEKAVITNNDNV